MPLVETNQTAYQRSVLRAGMEQAQQRGAWLGVDLVALADNLRAIRSLLAPSTKLMAVVKADAYGHGALAVAEAALANGATHLGVATVEEGQKLRRSHVHAPILVLGLVPDKAYQAAIESHLQVTVSSGRQVQVVERIAAGLGKVADLHLKVNTGMTRVGCELHEAAGLAKYVLDSTSVRLNGVSSHLATAEAPLPVDAEAQVSRFAELADALKLSPKRVLRHVANSAGTLYLPSAHMDMVRVGLAMYGCSPRGNEPAPVRLRQVLSLRARVAQVKEVPPGTVVGYGGTWTASRATRLALLPVGYADGMPRSLSNRGEVLVRGVRCPIVGRVSMDQTIVDVGSIAVEPGEEVLLLGAYGDKPMSVERWADLDGSVNYEILCGLGQRLPKVYYR